MRWQVKKNWKVFIPRPPASTWKRRGNFSEGGRVIKGYVNNVGRVTLGSLRNRTAGRLRTAEWRKNVARDCAFPILRDIFFSMLECNLVPRVSLLPYLGTTLLSPAPKKVSCGARLIRKLSQQSVSPTKGNGPTKDKGGGDCFNLDTKCKRQVNPPWYEREFWELDQKRSSHFAGTQKLSNQANLQICWLSIFYFFIFNIFR